MYYNIARVPASWEGTHTWNSLARSFALQCTSDPSIQLEVHQELTFGDSKTLHSFWLESVGRTRCGLEAPSINLGLIGRKTLSALK